SSRRRHTRSDRDWSSDVCSSDLPIAGRLCQTPWRFTETPYNRIGPAAVAICFLICATAFAQNADNIADREVQRRQAAIPEGEARSEERRVGKEGKCLWASSR